MKHIKSILKKDGVLLNIISVIILFAFIAYWTYNPFKIGFSDCGIQHIHSNNPSVTPFEPQVTSCFLKAFTNCSKAQVVISDVGTDNGETIEATIQGKDKSICKVYVHDRTFGVVNYNEKKDIQQVCTSVREELFSGGKELTFNNCTRN